MTRIRNLAGVLALGGAAAFAFNRWAAGKPGSDDRARIAYPPLDTLKRVDENVWIVDSGPIKPMGLSVPVRMTIIRLSGGDLFLHSPTTFSASLAAEIGRIGTVRHLVAPTIAHWTFISDWQRAFPEAEVWAVPGLALRPQVRRSDLRIDHDLGPVAPPVWDAEVEQGLVNGGGGFKEAFFFHKASRTLILADLVQNLEADKLPPITAAMAEAALATRGCTAAHVRTAVLLGGNEAREAIRGMLSLEPDKVIFAHGDWFASDGAARLRRAFDWIG